MADSDLMSQRLRASRAAADAAARLAEALRWQLEVDEALASDERAGGPGSSATLDVAGLEKHVGKGIRWCQLRMRSEGFPRGRRMSGSRGFYWLRAEVDAWMAGHLTEWRGGLHNGAQPRGPAGAAPAGAVAISGCLELLGRVEGPYATPALADEVEAMRARLRGALGQKGERQ